MFDLDTTALLFAGGWALAAICVGMVCGFFLGRAHTLRHEPKRLKQDRQQTLEALVKLLDSTKQLNEDVDTHNSELKSAKCQLEEIDSSETPQEMDSLQSRLISNISRVVQSNRKLENDLVVSRYRLENQAQELDRTRVEARTDGLCATGNRKAFDESLQFMVSQFRKKSQPFGLMLIDIDHFKRINDTFGHSSGDTVLASIGQALKECVRPGDMVCRIGGDEFALILDGVTDQTARTVGTRIRSTIERYSFAVGSNDQETVVTMSMGLAVAREDDDIKAIYDRADEALYKSKDQGRNRLNTICTNGQPPVVATGGDFEAPTTIQSYEEFKESLMGEPNHPTG